MSETNEVYEVSKSPEDSVVSNEDAPASSSVQGTCSCQSTTGIHQGCNEFNDGKKTLFSTDSKLLIIILNKIGSCHNYIYHR